MTVVEYPIARQPRDGVLPCFQLTGPYGWYRDASEYQPSWKPFIRNTEVGEDPMADAHPEMIIWMSSTTRFNSTPCKNTTQSSRSTNPTPKPKQPSRSSRNLDLIAATSICNHIQSSKNMQGSVSLIRPVTREMVHARTIEIAVLDGRDSHEIKQFDYEQAKRELTGESDFDKQQAVFDFNEYC